ncbi:MAG: N-carbamoylputrescine amidase, partial [Betaproteobacteria bacterium]
MTALTVACIQLNAGNDVEANLAGASQAIRDAAGKGAQLV